MYFTKYPGNPVLGNKTTGTCFDAAVITQDGRYRMDFSWRPKKALAVTFSDDGIHWDEPIITLESNPESGWEDNINRNSVVILPDGSFRMWYTGQARGYSFIGYAESDDGLNWRRFDEPVLISERHWEGLSVMNPCVLYDRGIFRMWYAAGETYEPNVLAYAESEGGIVWHKSRINPIFVADPSNEFERARVGGCQVIKTDDMGYLMFYIGYKDIHTACVCCAGSPDGVTRWERSPNNPMVLPDAGAWDCDSCYKPAVAWDEKSGSWLLWYNGRRGNEEYIGLARRQGRELF